MEDLEEIGFTVNGEEIRVPVEDMELLSDTLKRRLRIRSIRIGCESGDCGSCTVLMDNKAVKSCMVLTRQAEGSNIITIEGLEKNGRLHPIQKAFIEEKAVQCGFCTPGMIMSAYSLLEENPDPSEMEIKESITGNICRCTGYTNIIKAIEKASEEVGVK